MALPYRRFKINWSSSQKKYKEASEMYQQAVDTSPTEKASHESTWRQAKSLLEKLEASDEIQMETLMMLLTQVRL